MSRFVQFAFVALLAFSASGLVDLALSEPCQLTEPTTQEDANCPATCVRCQCCPQSIEILGHRSMSVSLRFVANPALARNLELTADPSEVLHVPRSAVL